MTVKRQQVRIIAGRWRGRTIAFPDLPTLRPTPDRLRETFFNWLAPEMVGARCLDAFAGSGAMGFEAASRGAASVVMVESARPAVLQLQATRTRLEATNVIITQASMPGALSQLQGPFDIIFLDPPFQSELQVVMLTQLAASLLVTPETLVTVESPVAITESLQAPWHILKSTKVGNVFAYLLQTA